MSQGSKALPAELLPYVAARVPVVSPESDGRVLAKGSGRRGRSKYDLIHSHKHHPPPTTKWPMTSAVWQEVIETGRGAGCWNAVHVTPAAGRLETVYWIIATSKGRPRDTTSYLLAQLEHQWGQCVHRGGAQFRRAVKCPNNRVDDAWGIIGKIQGLRKPVQCLQGNPEPDRGKYFT